VTDPRPARPAGSDAADHEAVRSANLAFYSAFEASDVEAMSALWEHSDRASCVHPGWPVLRGWTAIARSWSAILSGPDRLQVILTDERVVVVGEVGWVTVDENLLGQRQATVTAVNVFTRTTDGWRMVAHHGSAVVARR